MHPRHWQGFPFGWIHLALVSHSRSSPSIHAPSGSEPQGTIYTTMNGPKPFLKPPTHTTTCSQNFISFSFPFTAFPIANHHIPLTAYRIPHTAYRIPLTAYRLPLTDYRLPITALPSTDYRLPNTACRRDTYQTTRHSTKTKPNFPLNRSRILPSLEKRHVTLRYAVIRHSLL